METKLIQRAFIRDNPLRRGIYRFVQILHMYSDKFKPDVLQKSLSRINEKSNEYVYLESNIKDKTIWVLCKISQKDEVDEYLMKLADKKMKLEKHSAFDIYIKAENIFDEYANFWWDVENDIMFWKENSVFFKKIKTIISPK